MSENEYNQLIDITDTLELEPWFNEDESLEIYYTCYELMGEFISENPTLISEPYFEEIFYENIANLMHANFDNLLYNDDEIDDIIEQCMIDLFTHVIPNRSLQHHSLQHHSLQHHSLQHHSLTNIEFKTSNKEVDDKIDEDDKIDVDDEDVDEDDEEEEKVLDEKKEYIKRQIDVLRSIYQPTQRTPEWYQYRYNLITASNAYKAFESQSMQNQLIYEKCKPLVINSGDVVQSVNTNTTLHWGQKYEPLSVMIYEHRYHTKIEDFGCIKHDVYGFIGASPDGINVDPKSPLYGRMLEIKNIVNRDITGIPKKEYWIQMQLQMEVCKLDECDFLETKFTEYPDYSTYAEDTDETTGDLNISKDHKRKGTIMYFQTLEGLPKYVYQPLNLTSKEIGQWREKMIANSCHIFIKIIFWKLDIFSCVLVHRNRQWFQDNVGKLEMLWKTVEQERVTGYEHRAPKKIVKSSSSNKEQNTSTSSGKCLLTLTKSVN